MFENPEFREDDPKMTAEIVVLMGEVSTKFTSFYATESCASANLFAHRCRNTVRPQRRSWVSYRLGSTWVLTVRLNFRMNA